MEAALADGDVALAVRTVHTVKGTAGNLGAGALHQAARAVESALRDDGAQERPEGFEAFRAALDAAVAAVEGCLPRVETVPSAEGVSTDGLSAELARELAGKLRVAAEMGDVSAAEELARLLPDGSPWAVRIESLAGDFDTDGLASLAGELEEQNGG